MIRLTAGQWYVALAALIVAIVAVLLYYRRTVPPITGRVRWPLIALRVIAAIALFLALADALWASLRVDRSLHDLFILIDHSESMAQTDERDATRAARSEEYAHRLQETFAERAAVHPFYFAEDLQDGAAPPESLGTSTALGTALASLAERARAADPRAVVVLTDGATNRGIDAVAAAARIGVPVVTVGFGDIIGAQARVAAVTAPEVVLTDQPFEVVATVESGESPENVTVRLAAHGRAIAQETLALEGGAIQTEVTFPATLNDAGMHDLRIDVIGADGRAVPTAGQTLFVRALKGRLKVLLLGGALDWEYTHLIRFLRRQPRVDLVARVEGNPSFGDPLPTESEWSQFDVAIIVHPSPRQLESLWGPHADGFARPGHGAAILLDSRFASTGSGRPPYPLEFMSGVPEMSAGEFTLEPVATRQNHPLVRFDPASDWNQTLTQWTARPPWTGVFCFENFPRDADVLVHARAGLSTTECPAIWTRFARGGKTMVISGGPLWRWEADRALRGEAAGEYDAFWSNAIRWLSLRDDTDRLAIRTDRQVYHVGEPIHLDAAVYDEVYRFLDRAEVTARIWPDSAVGDTLRLFLPPGPGNRFVGHVSHLEPGTYQYNGVAVVDSVTYNLSGDVFRVESYGLEQQHYSLNKRLLERVAMQTGGRYYPESQSPAFLDSLDWSAATRETIVEIPLWNKTIVLAVFVVALTAEWFVRRRKQLL
ncbi:MAG: vWA domain-containing protein [Candidatus Zixiibacteriota bacterium]